MRIRAAVARTAAAPLSLEELDIEDPREGEILVRVVAAGICHTDIVVRDGMLPTPLPAVLGHEGAGVVEKVGSAVSKVAPCDHVVMTFNSCGRCPSCRSFHETYCYEFFPHNFLANRLDGSSSLSSNGEKINSNFFGQSSFATYAISHERNTVKVPEDAKLELLAPLGCGVQTGAGAVMNALGVGEDDSIAVFGTGSVGLSGVMAAHALGAAMIVAVDLSDDRLAFAKTVGATHTLNPSAAELVPTLLEITDGGLDFAFDTTGASSVIRQAVESLAPRGTCGIVGASALGTEIVLDEVHFMSGGRRLMGIVEGESNPDEFIPRLIELNRAGKLPYDRMIEFYELDAINEAITDSETGKVIKPVVRMS
jgi:aryl-alcohol dehydrogenase